MACLHNQSENLYCISQRRFSMIGKCSSRAQPRHFPCLIVYDSLSRSENSVKKMWRRVWGMIRAEKVKLKRMVCLANQTPRALRFLRVKMRGAWQWPKQPRLILYCFALSMCNCGLYSSFWHNKNQFSTVPSALD